MSCRKDKGSSAMNGLATTSVEPGAGREVERVFHSLKATAERENAADTAAGTPTRHPDPTRADVDEFIDRQAQKVRLDPMLSASRKDTLQANLVIAKTQPTPDGATFHAWQNVQSEAAIRVTRCPTCGKFEGRSSHTCVAPGQTRVEAKDEKKKEWRTEQDATIDRLKDSLDQGVADLVTSDGWREYLEANKKFRNYSPQNALLIQLQDPDATRCASASTWKELGREVNPDAKKLDIRAPTSRTKTRTTVDEVTGEETTETMRRRPGFYSTTTIDISQTTGPPLPEVTHLLAGEAPAGMQKDLEDQIRSHGYEIRYEEIPGSANGYTTARNATNKVVVVDSRLSPAQRAKTTIHELGHIVNSHVDDLEHYHSGPGGCRGRFEVEAEATAFIVSGAKGMDTGDYSFGYVAGWARGDAKKAKQHAEKAVASSRSILDGKWTHMEATAVVTPEPASV